jgi:threonine aldolase
MVSVGPAQGLAIAASSRFLQLHGRRSSRQLLAEIGSDDADIEMDRYGSGGVVAELETTTASILGKEAAVFVPSGTMAQQAVLRVHADHRARTDFVCHPACHLDNREGRGYQRLHGLACHTAGDLNLPLTAADLEGVAAAPAALVIELPQRDLGGHLPAWEELRAQVAWARGQDAAVHLDGARLWECTPSYQRSPAKIAAPFDTVYVSFYKGLGALGGACLAGSQRDVAEVREWRARHGGTLPSMWPYAASALSALRLRLPRMPAYYSHAQAIATAVASVPGVEVVPDPPNTPMMHLLISATADELADAVLRLAREQGIWTFGAWFTTASPRTQCVELAVGDATLGFPPDEVAAILGALVTRS